MVAIIEGSDVYAEIICNSSENKYNNRIYLDNPCGTDYDCGGGSSYCNCNCNCDQN